MAAEVFFVKGESLDDEEEDEKEAFRSAARLSTETKELPVTTLHSLACCR